MITALAAAKAYAAQGSMAAPSLGGTGEAKKAMDFGAMLKLATTDTLHQTRAAETKMAQQAAGKAEPKCRAGPVMVRPRLTPPWSWPHQVGRAAISLERRASSRRSRPTLRQSPTAPLQGAPPSG